MRFNLPAILYLISLIFLSGCQTLSSNNQSVSENSTDGLLPIAIAVQVNYQDEVNILRLNELLADQKELKGSDRARLFYERALIYDRMGLAAHSRYDLTQAINTDPTFAPAYNTLGVYLLLNRSFDQAFEAFDTALELSDKMEYSYLHRAIGLFQVDRFSLASKDIEAFYAIDSNDPYRVLWRYIINSKVDPEAALKSLKESERLSDDNRYAWSLIDVIVGNVEEEQFFNSISNGIYTNEELAQRLCEAYFYLGYWHQIGGNMNKAIYYFKSTTASNIHDFIEYKYALMELASIQIERDAKQKDN